MWLSKGLKTTKYIHLIEAPMYSFKSISTFAGQSYCCKRCTLPLHYTLTLFIAVVTGYLKTKALYENRWSSYILRTWGKVVNIPCLFEGLLH